MQLSWRTRLSITGVLISLAAMPRAFAATEVGSMSLSSLQANGMGVFVNGGDTETGMISWTPAYRLSDALSVRGNLGISYFKGTLDNHFLVGDYEALLGYNLMGPWVLEAGGGAQSWFGSAGTGAVASGNVAWTTESKLFGAIDRIFGGYTRGFGKLATSNEFKIGIGATF